MTYTQDKRNEKTLKQTPLIFFLNTLILQINTINRKRNSTHWGFTIRILKEAGK